MATLDITEGRRPQVYYRYFLHGTKMTSTLDLASTLPGVERHYHVDLRFLVMRVSFSSCPCL